MSKRTMQTNFALKGLEAPPRRSSRLQAPPPAPVEAPDNLTQPTDQNATALQDMNFKVRPDFHLRFKAEATLRGMSMKDLLEASFVAYLEQHGKKSGL